MDTYYTILGVQSNATTEQINAAYKAAAKKHHPDKNGGSETATDYFSLINNARDTLIDPVKRYEYDCTIGIKNKPTPTPPPPPPPDKSSNFIPGILIGTAVGLALAAIFSGNSKNNN